MRFAIVVSEFNEKINNGMLAAAKQFLAEQDCPVREEDVFSAPGAFEIPLLAQALANTKKYAGVIGLGCVIKGETAHFEFISLGASVGLMQTMLATEVPVSFGILTTYNRQQATARSSDDEHNKGIEAAAACWKTARQLQRIKSL